jgi:hypothetical protein
MLISFLSLKISFIYLFVKTCSDLDLSRQGSKAGSCTESHGQDITAWQLSVFVTKNIFI